MSKDETKLGFVLFDAKNRFTISLNFPSKLTEVYIL